jgi:peptidoglycan/LPS O-acetylase OafA/YrhL
MRDNTSCAPKTIINGRNWQLDGLRALAVTSVLISHFWPTTRLLDLANIGHLGVRLFFVLSGYLITGILLRCRSSMEAGQSDAATNLRRFYIRRFLRIFPPYYALLALMVMARFPGVRETRGGMRAMQRTSFLLSKAIGHLGLHVTSGPWRSRSSSISFGRS